MSKAFIASLLEHLDVPASSQLLVFSRTSLQTRRISGSNPRALYFNENVYVGYIPGGKVEITSLDPELGGMFYIFDIPKSGRTTGDRTGGGPLYGLSRCRRDPARYRTLDALGDSWFRLGQLVSFRRKQIGHQIPLSERFGGWHVTGEPGVSDDKGNLSGGRWWKDSHRGDRAGHSI